MVKQKRTAQEYDQTLKALFGQEVAEILPILLPEAEFISEQNVEIDRTIIKADLVFRGRYKKKPHIFNMELQSSKDGRIEVRLLMYHVALHYKHKLPVISVILYPFETTMPTPPYREQGGDGTLLTFKYKVLPLGKLEAPRFVRRHAVCLYTLLPAMKHATVPLLKQALREMRQRYPDDKEFGHHLVRFHRIMQRSTTMDEQGKQVMEEVLKMEYAYDQLIDDNPEVKKRVERGRVEAMRDLIIAAIEIRFPSLVTQVQQQIEQIQKPKTLEKFCIQLVSATTEERVRKLLQTRETGRKQKP